ncbi:MAG TPA: DUF4013 domain-containing protein, partial [Methanobacterium sp.]|nr:DUF4013 domain-containing protein [Methanobacterium sp.]
FLVLGVFIAFSAISTSSILLGAKNSALIGVLGAIGYLNVALIFGYSFRIIKSSLAGITELPEFNDWFEMFTDGIKFMVVNFVYLIPVILIIILLLFYSGSDLRLILTGLYNLNLDLLLYVGFSHSIPLIIALLYLIMIIPTILVSIANMAYNNGELGAAFKFKEIFFNSSKYWDNTSWQRMFFYNDLIPVVMGAFMLYELIEQIGHIGWDKILIWYIANGIISLTLILIGYITTNITSILILHGLGLYSLSNCNILRMLIISLILLPYLFIFLSRSTALIYNYTIKDYLISEIGTKIYQSEYP